MAVTELRRDQSTAIDQASRALAGLAAGVSRQLSTFLDGVLYDSQAIASLEEVVRMDAEKAQGHLESMVIHQPLFSNLSIFDPSGNLIASARPDTPSPVSAWESFQTATKMGRQAWMVAEGLTSSRQRLLVHTPIRDAQRRVVGVLGASIDLEGLATKIGMTNLAQSGWVFVLDASGRVLLHPDQEEIQKRADYSWIGASFGGSLTGSGTTEFSYRDEAIIASYAQIPDSGWTVFAARPKAVVLAEAPKNWQAPLMAMAAVIVLAFVCSAIVTHFLVRPLRRLAMAAKAFGQGQKEALTSKARLATSEADILFSEFALMKDRIVAREAELSQSEALFRALVSKSPVGFYIVQDRRFVFVNPMFQEITGYSKEELLGKDPLGIVLNEHRDTVRQRAIEMLKCKGVSPYEYAIVAKGGERRWIAETVSSIEYQGKRASLGTFMDVTARKQAEKAAEERSQRLAALYEISLVVRQSLNLQTVAERALAETIRTMKLDAGTIRYLDEASQELVLLAHQGLTPGILDNVQVSSPIKVGQGLSGRAVQTGEPVLTEDLGQEGSHFFGNTISQAFRSGVYFPLKAGGTAMGTVAGFSRVPRHFTPDDMEMISSLGSMVGMAIANARLYTELDKRNREVSALLAIDRVIARDFPLPRALDEALSILMRALDANMAGVHRLSDGNKMELVAHRGMSSQLLEFASRAKVGDILSGQAILTGRPVTIDVSQFPTDRARHILMEEGTSVLAAAPMLIGQRPMGAIVVSRKHPSPFTREDLALLQSAACQIVASHDRARLIQELEEWVDRQRTIGRIATAISSNLDMEKIFLTLSAELAKLVAFDRLSVATVNADHAEIMAFSEESSGSLPRRMSVPLADLILSRVIQNGKPIIRRNIEQETETPYDRKILESGLRSSVVVPLAVSGRAFGALNLSSYETGKFSESDLVYLQPVADHLALALENARLFRQVEAKGQEWQQTFDSMSDGVALLSPELRLQRVNTAFATMLGSRPAALIGQPCYGLAHGLCEPIAGCIGRRCIDQKVSRNLVIRETHLDNRWLHLACDPLMDPLGKMSGIVCAVRDITSEKEREEKLARLNELSLAVSRSLDLQAVASLAIEAVLKLLNFDGGLIWYADDATQEIRLLEQRNLPEGMAREIVRHPRMKFSQGLAGFVAQSGQPVIVEDIRHDPRVLDDATRLSGFQAYVGLPLKVRDQVVGVISCLSHQKAGLGLSDIEFLSGIGNLLGIAVVNSRLYEETRERVNELEDLYATVQLLTSTLDFEKLAVLALERLVAILKKAPTSGGLLLFDKDQTELTVAAVVGPDAATMKELHLPLAMFRASGLSEIVNDLTQRREPFLFTDMQRLPPPLLTFRSVQEAQAFLILPLVIRGHVMGLIAWGMAQVPELGHDELRKLAIHSCHIASALEIAMMYEQTEERAESLAGQMTLERQRFEMIFNSVAEGIYVSGTDLKMVSWNPAAERLTGWKLAEVTGKSCADFLSHQDEKGNRLCGTDDCPLQVALKHDNPTQPKRVYAHTKQGGLAIHALSGAPVRNATGQIVGLVMVFRDVSREAETERLKADFVSIVSHELRTPLSSILGFTELLLTRDAGAEKRQHWLEVIQTESRRLANLIDDLLDISRIEAGRVTLRPEAIDLRQAIAERFDTFQPSLKRHELIAQLPGDLPRAKVDYERLHRILDNLLSNAIKYSPNGGKIVVSAHPDGPWVKVSVADEGVGIPPDKHEEIFQRFRQLDSFLTRSIAGVGLGLAITKASVELHGGRIWVESAVDQGSTFHFTLPVAQQGGG